MGRIESADWTLGPSAALDADDIRAVADMAEAALDMEWDDGGTPGKITGSQEEFLLSLDAEARSHIAPLDWDGERGAIEGETCDMGFVAPIVSFRLREKRLNTPVIIDIDPKDRDMGDPAIAVIGPKGWSYVETWKIAKEPFGEMARAVTAACGGKIADAMLEKAKGQAPGNGPKA